MIRAATSISSLLSGIGLFLAGSGLLGLLISLRAAEDGLSNAMIGLVMSGFYVGYIVGAWLGPSLIERVGHIRTFTACAAGSAAAALLCALVDHPMLWWGLRIINGVLLMGLFMVVESWLIERTSQTDADLRSRSQVFAIYVIVNLVALAIGQYLLLIYGVSSVNSYVVVAILFSLAVIPVALTPVAQPAAIKTDRVPMRRLFAVAPAGAMASLFSGLIVGSFWSLAAIFAQTLGLSTEQVATFIVVTVGGGIALQWPIGWLSDHYDRRHILGWVSVLAALSMLTALNWNQQLVVLFTSAFLFGGMIFSIYGLAVAQTHDRFYLHETLEATRGTLLLHGIGAAAGPLITGLLMQWQRGGFALTMVALTITLAAFVALRIRRDPPVPLDERSPYTPMEQTSPLVADFDPRTPDNDDSIDHPEPITPDVADLPPAPAEEKPALAPDMQRIVETTG